MPTKTSRAQAVRPPAFWDASGLVLLVIEQTSSKRARAIQRATGTPIVWWGSRVEITSSLTRLVRDGLIDVVALTEAEERLSRLERGSFEVQPSEEVRSKARDLLRTHPLRAGDALQLAAALVAFRDRPRGRVFVCFDQRLAACAASVGFDVRS